MIDEGQILTVTLEYEGPLHEGVMFLVDTVPHTTVAEFTFTATVNTSTLSQGGNATLSAGLNANSIFMMASYFTAPALFSIDILAPSTKKVAIVVLALEPGIRRAPFSGTIVNLPFAYRSPIAMDSYYSRGAWTTIDFLVKNPKKESLQFIVEPSDNIEVFEGPAINNMTLVGRNVFYFNRDNQYASLGYPDTFDPNSVCPFLVSSADANYTCKNGTKCLQAGCCGANGLNHCPAGQKMCMEPFACDEDYCCAADCGALNQFVRNCLVPFSVDVEPAGPTPPPTPAPTDAPKGGSSSSDGLSGGAIFLIIFFSILGAYVLFGCIFNWMNGVKQFPRMLPHYAFWCELPSFISEGFGFLRSKICGGGQTRQSVFAGQEFSEAPRETMGQGQEGSLSQSNVGSTAQPGGAGYSTL